MATLPSVRQLTYLAALSDSLSFTRAAELCFVTQSTLSNGIKKLESILDVPLVERNRHHILMTPIGLEVADRAKHLLAQINDLTGMVKKDAKPMQGVLRLGVIPTIAPFLLAKSLKIIRESYPNLQLLLSEDQTDQLLKKLNLGRLDFILLALPYDLPNYLTKTIFKDKFSLVGKAALLKKHTRRCHSFNTRNYRTTYFLRRRALSKRAHTHCLRVCFSFSLTI